MGNLNGDLNLLGARQKQIGLDLGLNSRFCVCSYLLFILNNESFSVIWWIKEDLYYANFVYGRELKVLRYYLSYVRRIIA